VDHATRSRLTATTPSGDSAVGPATEAASRAKLIDMNRTRLVAMAVLVPVAAVVAAAIITAVASTAAFSVTEISAGPPMAGFRQEGGNRGW
jgi:hypothetical protein